MTHDVCQCDCKCGNYDEHTAQGFSCEKCFADCVTSVLEKELG